MKIIFASKNPGKINEIKKILEPPQFEVISMNDAGIDIEIDENGTSFEENAVKKAVEIAGYIRKRYGETDSIIMADDSGLEIDCLDKQPGVYSARYLGHDTPYNIKNKMILDMIKGVSGGDRSARFVCAIACVTGRICKEDNRQCVIMPDKMAFDENVIVTRASLEGMIAQEAGGNNGFGYDPIFYIEEFQKTLAEIDISVKNKISHRGNALRLMKDKLREGGFL